MPLGRAAASATSDAAGSLASTAASSSSVSAVAGSGAAAAAAFSVVAVLGETRLLDRTARPPAAVRVVASSASRLSRFRLLFAPVLAGADVSLVVAMAAFTWLSLAALVEVLEDMIDVRREVNGRDAVGRRVVSTYSVRRYDRPVVMARIDRTLRSTEHDCDQPKSAQIPPAIMHHERANVWAGDVVDHLVTGHLDLERRWQIRRSRPHDQGATSHPVAGCVEQT